LAVHVVQDFLALLGIFQQRLQFRLHRREPDLLVELVLETGTRCQRLFEQRAELRILLAVRENRPARYQREQEQCCSGGFQRAANPICRVCCACCASHNIMCPPHRTLTMSAEHYETGDVPPAKNPARGVYWLPNVFTTGTLFGGFYAIVAAINGDLSRAAIAIFVAMVFDGLDGRVARWTNTQSDFGKEYDSLCDMVAFGVAPAIVAYQWGIERIADYGKFWGRFGWLAAFFYAVAAALRLARFNARPASADKRYFEGLPSPSAAATVASFVWLASELDLGGEPHTGGP